MRLFALCLGGCGGKGRLGGAAATAEGADGDAYEGAATTISGGAVNEERRMRTRLSPR